MPIRSPVAVAGPRWPAGTLLDRLPSSDYEELLSLGTRITFLPGKEILRQGDPHGPVYLLLHGRHGRAACVKVTASADNGTEALLGIRVTGDVVGELAALRKPGYRSATVTTCSEINTVRLPQQDFLHFLHRQPERWEALGGMLTERLDWANRRRLDFAGYAVPQRLARVILELAGRHGHETSQGHELGVQLSQEELGMLVGAKKAAASKAMRELARRKLVSSEYRHVVVLNMATLSNYASADP